MRGLFRYGMRLLVAAGIVAGMMFPGCDSPVAIDTPRLRFVEQPAGGGEAPFTAVLVLDASGSMADSGRAAAVQSATRFIDSMRTGRDAAAVLWFANGSTVALTVTGDAVALRSAISALPAAGSTTLWDGMAAGLAIARQGDTATVRAVITLTDGMDNGSVTVPDSILAQAAASGIRLYTIGFGGAVPGPTLKRLADGTGGTWHDVRSVAALTPTWLAILRHLRARP